MATLLTCPICGFGFDRRDTQCAHGCPLGPLCTLLRCPNCEYEFPETLRRVGWLRKLLPGGERARSGLPDNVHRAAAALAEYAETAGTDLIVIASHGTRGLERLLLGSVAERTTRLAPCSVLTVKAFGKRLLEGEAEAG